MFLSYVCTALYIFSGNILLDANFEAKISDLGMAQHATSGSETGLLTHIFPQRHREGLKCLSKGILFHLEWYDIYDSTVYNMVLFLKQYQIL